MASKKTSVETPGAVAAAHDYIEDATAKLGKHNDTIRAHGEELASQVRELTATLGEERKAHEAEVVRMKESRDREVAGLQQRLGAAESKLARVIQTLA